MTIRPSRIRMLLVDDEVDFLESTSRALERRGFEVTRAQNGLSALAELERETFDIAVVDVKMPGMDGLELFRTIRRRVPGLPVVILTGHGTIRDAFQTTKEGLYQYLTKPCEIEELAALARRAAADRRPEIRDLGADLKGARVLLVDDEVELTQSLARVLGRRGLRVTTASNGSEALELFRERRFDLVVLDVKMPQLGGVEVLRRIKGVDPSVEVILLTGHPSVRTAVEGLESGAFDYLLKPPEIETLLAKLEQAYLHRRDRLQQEREAMLREIVEGRAD